MPQHEAVQLRQQQQQKQQQQKQQQQQQVQEQAREPLQRLSMQGSSSSDTLRLQYQPAAVVCSMDCQPQSHTAYCASKLASGYATSDQPQPATVSKLRPLAHTASADWSLATEILLRKTRSTLWCFIGVWPL
jgi:hypothetical protein